MKFSYQTLILILLSFNAYSSLKDKSFLKKDEYQIKRTWVRRLAPKDSIKTNEISQEFNPLVKDNGNIIQATFFGGIFELNKYGQKKWSYFPKYPVSGAGSLYKNFIFFGTQDKYVHIYDMNNKSILWSTLIDGAVSAISDFKDGRVFVLTDIGSLYSLKVIQKVIDWKVTRSPRKVLKIFGGAKPLLYKDQVLVAFPSGVVASLNQSTGAFTWESQLKGAQKYEDIDFLLLSEKRVLIAGAFDEALYRLDLKNGKILWQAYEKPVSPFADFKGNIYFSNANGELVSLGLSSGNLVFRKKIFQGLGGKPVFLDNKIIVSDSKGPIRYMHKDTGAVLASYELISSVSSDIILNKTKNKFYVLSDKGYLYYFGIKK